jgi:hypothetical protein
MSALIKANEYTPDLLPDDRLPPEIADGDLYKTAGYAVGTALSSPRKMGSQVNRPSERIGRNTRMTVGPGYIR